MLTCALRDMDADRSLGGIKSLSFSCFADFGAHGGAIS
jgi:hypothetical protein